MADQMRRERQAVLREERGLMWSYVLVFAAGCAFGLSAGAAVVLAFLS